MKLIIVSLAITFLAAAKQHSTLDLIFALAQEMETARLVNLASSDVVRDNALYSHAADIALFMVDAKTYGDRFVQKFPQTATGVMNDLYEGIELKKYTPEFLFAFKSLGRLAREGSRPAAEKLVGALIVSDGVVSEQLCEDFMALMNQRPRLAIQALAATSGARRDLYASCFPALDPSQRECLTGKLQALSLADQTEADVAREVLGALQNP